ncbi:kinase-like domain-containing protein [Scenedesmus sp. NREL 46B-D3]|nr:kinase-like domain-containing protein [Scenedesmus sp. NREL 46B-D3]
MNVIRKAKAVMQELHAICAENSWSTCCQAAQVLQQQLLGVENVSIAAQTGSPGTCILAGAYGPGTEWQQQQVFMSGAGWSPCMCLQQGGQHLYRTGRPDGAAADEGWPEDWAHLHKEQGLSSFLAVPIADAHGRALGVLCLASNATGAFQDEEWWEPLLSMVCTGLATLLKSPVMSRLAELAGCLVDARDDFPLLAKAFVQGSAALVEAVTNVRVEVKLGLLSPDGQHVLMLYMPSRSPAGAIPPADDMFTGSQEAVRSIVVIPLLGAASAFGGVYVTHNEPGSFAECKAAIVEVSSLLQSLLLQGLAVPPQDWEQLTQQCGAGAAAVVWWQRQLQRQLHKQQQSFSGNMLQMLQAEVQQYGRSSSSKHGDDYLRDLQLLRLLGRGGFASVYEARWQGSLTAVKVMYVPQRLRGVMKAALEMAMTEALSHPNIVRTFACLSDLVQEAGGHEASALTPSSIRFRPLRAGECGDECDSLTLCNLIIMELCRMGTCARRSTKGCCTSSATATRRTLRVLQALLDIARALEHLHCLNIMHCDVKSSNIFLQHSSGGKGFVCKLADFGLSKLMGEDRSYLINQSVSGTITNLAPERMLVRALWLDSTLEADVVTRRVANSGLGAHDDAGDGDSDVRVAVAGPQGDKITLATDVFAFGLLMFTAFTGQEPVCEGFRPPLPAGMPRGYAELLSCCWAHEPALRPRMGLVVQQLQALLLHARGVRH